MSSQINFFMQTDHFCPEFWDQNTIFKAKPNFQKRFRVPRPKFQRSMFWIGYPEFQSFGQACQKISFRRKTFKVTRKIKKINRIPKEPLLNPCLSPHNTTQFIISSYQTSESEFLGFSNVLDGFGSMIGLVKSDSLSDKQHSKSEESKSKVEEMLQFAKIERDPFRLFIVINRLATMVKEKDEQILVLERKISSTQAPSNCH